jgi:hypothetical protein
LQCDECGIHHAGHKRGEDTGDRDPVLEAADGGRIDNFIVLEFVLAKEIAKTLPALVRTRMGDSPPKPKWENSVTDAASIVAMPASTALPPLVNKRMPASVAYSEPPPTAPRVPREGKRTGRCPG